MDESLKCECGETKFWFFWSFARCTKCFNEYKKTEFYDSHSGQPPEDEYWLRRFNNESHQYSNWEKFKINL